MSEYTLSLQDKFTKAAEAASPFGSALGMAREVGIQAEAAKGDEMLAVVGFKTAERQLKEAGATPLLESLVKISMQQMEKWTGNSADKLRTKATSRSAKALEQESALKGIIEARKTRGGSESQYGGYKDLGKQIDKKNLNLAIPDLGHPIEAMREGFNKWRKEMNGAAAKRYTDSANTLDKISQTLKTGRINLWGEGPGVLGELTAKRAAEVGAARAQKDMAEITQINAKDNSREAQAARDRSEEAEHYMPDAAATESRIKSAGGDENGAVNKQFQTEMSARAAGTTTTN